MKRVCFILLSFIAGIIFSYGQVPVYMWAEALSGNVEEIQRGTVVDNSGNVYITGVFFGTVDFDPSGAVASITPSPYGSNVYIAKYDIGGIYQWAKNIPINTSYGNNSITIDASSNLYITGYYSGSVDFNPGAGTATLSSASGSNDIYLAKYDQNGNYIWAKGIGSTGDDRGNEVLVNAEGNILLAGNFNGTVDFDPGAGTTSLTSAASSDIYFAKFDASGNFLWVKQISGTGADDLRDLAIDAQGNIFLTGKFDGATDFDPGAGIYSFTTAGLTDIFSAKYDASGNLVWAQQFGSTSYDCGTSNAIDTSGNLLITGTFNNTADFDPGAAVMNLTAAVGGGSYFGKFDTDGNYLWVKGLPLNTSNIDIMADYCNHIYIAGDYLSGGAATIDLDPGVGTASISVPGGLPPPYYNIFGRYDTDGNYLWAAGFGRTCYCSVAGYKSSLAKDTAGYIYYSGIFNAPFFGTSTVDFDPGAGVANLIATSTVDNTFFAKYDVGCPLDLLPIIFSSFTGENIDHINYLYWSTLSELNSDYFEVEKSDDGQFFTPIGRVAAAGFSVEEHAYRFADDGEIEGMHYYRIREVDVDGAIIFSNVIMIAAMSNEITIFPNPTSGSVTVSINNEGLAGSQIILFNYLGEPVLPAVTISGNQIHLNLQNLPAGIYQLIIQPQNTGAEIMHTSIVLHK